MQVKVLFFGALRERLGVERVLELQEGATVADLFELLSPDALLTTCAVAVNLEYVSRDHALLQQDEVALLPPVSGGSDAPDDQNAPVALLREPVALVRELIVTADLLRSFSLGTDGAIVTFEGIVRNNTRGRSTRYLEYEAYEDMAIQQMRQLLITARSEHAVRDALIVHRLGRIEIGEASVVIAVASAHRAEAFAACRWLIDTLKNTVPIWKKEYFEDGAEWAGGEPFPQEPPQ